MFSLLHSHYNTTTLLTSDIRDLLRIEAGHHLSTDLLEHRLLLQEKVKQEVLEEETVTFGPETDEHLQSPFI